MNLSDGSQFWFLLHGAAAVAYCSGTGAQPARLIDGPVTSNPVNFGIRSFRKPCGERITPTRYLMEDRRAVFCQFEKLGPRLPSTRADGHPCDAACSFVPLRAPSLLGCKAHCYSRSQIMTLRQARLSSVCRDNGMSVLATATTNCGTRSFRNKRSTPAVSLIQTWTTYGKHDETSNSRNADPR
jgi:hypothetical protein